jgi:hypothetical protein
MLLMIVMMMSTMTVTVSFAFSAYDNPICIHDYLQCMAVRYIAVTSAEQQAIVVEGHFATIAWLLDCLSFTEVLTN